MNPRLTPEHLARYRRMVKEAEIVDINNGPRREPTIFEMILRQDEVTAFLNLIEHQTEAIEYAREELRKCRGQQVAGRDLI